MAHDPHVGDAVAARVRWLGENQDITSHVLTDQIRRMWRGWDLALDDLAGPDGPDAGAHLWAFAHSAHGWAVTYLPDADRLWAANQQKAIMVAYQFSASARTLLTLCERLYGSGASQTCRAAVERVLSSPAIDPGSDRDATRLLLALRAPIAVL